MLGNKRIILSLALLGLLTAGALQAQVTGAITGTVTDSTGAVVPAAGVVIRNVETGVERRVVTNSSGVYAAEALQVGTYRVEVSVAGFKRAVRDGVQLQGAARVGVDFTLQIGEIAETVSVTAEAPLVNTETGDVSHQIETTQITDLSYRNRNFFALQQLIPGASRTAGDEIGIGLTGSRGFAVNGLRDKYGGLMVDGVQNTDMGNQTTAMTYPGLETIGEVKILSSNYTAEYGTAGGANMLLVTRSGSKQFHGALYHFLRNDELDARNFFATTRPKLRWNNFGYRIGGPVILPGYNEDRSKTFFFFAQEWRKRRGEQIIRAATPTQAMRNGDFSGQTSELIDPTTGELFPNARIPQSRINQNASLLLDSLFPLPNRPEAGFLNFQQNGGTSEDFRQETVRADHNFDQNTKVFFRYINDSWEQGTPTTLWAGQAFPTISSELDVPAENLVANFTKVLSPTTVVDFSYNYAHNYGSREKSAVTLQGAWQKPNGLTIPELFEDPADRPAAGTIVPDLSFAGGWGGIATSFFPWWAHHDIQSVKGNVSRQMGSHSLKFGAVHQFSRTPVQSQAVPNTSGAFSFAGTFTNHPHGDFLIGQAATYGESDSFPEPRYDYHQFEAYIQDDWKVSPRLTLNLGLRYFLIPHVYEKDDLLTVFRPERFDPAQAPTVLPDATLAPGSGDLLNGVVGVAGGLDRGLVQNHYDTLGPRLGFAWDLTGKGETVLRGGYGIGYYRVEGNDTYRLVANPPLTNQVTVFNPPLDDPSAGQAAAPRPKNLVTLDPVYQIPTVQSYSLGVQHRLARNTGLSVSYVGTRGTHLDRQRLLNQPFPAGGFDFDPRLNTREIPVELIVPFAGYSNIQQTETTGSSTYHSLQVNLKRTFSEGFMFQTSYTYSRTITDADGFGSVPQDSFNLNAERGLASFDRTHMAVVNWVYELPFFRNPRNTLQMLLGGWQINGITSFQSGTPRNVGLATGDRGIATRPDATGASAQGPESVAQWFNTAAFAAPAAGMFGNAGRNLVRGPGINQWDLQVFKNFEFSERTNLQFRWEMFNAFNNANFDGVSTALGSGNFGQVTSARDARVMQFGLKFEF